MSDETPDREPGSKLGNELDREDPRGGLGRLPVHPGLCATCVHLRLLASRRSVFARCGRAGEDPSLRRYPPLPVLSCSGYEAFPPAHPAR